MPTERLQKILARGGLASRRAAESLITEGRVRVNGRIVTELGTKADPRHDRIEVDGKRVVAEHPVYYVLNKPRGFMTTLHDPEGRPTIVNLLRPHAIPERVFPVGRLDFNTSGLLLLTNDGEFSDGLLHPKRAVPKSYVVKVQGVMTPDDIDRWRKGVVLEDGKTLPADAAFLRFETDKTWFEITIREGRNQQIRRMGDATGFRVMRLSRVAFAGITIEGLRPGEIRALTREELVQLKKDYDVPRHPSAAANAIEITAKRKPFAVARAKQDVRSTSGDVRGRIRAGSEARPLWKGETRDAGDERVAQRASRRTSPNERARATEKRNERSQPQGGQGGAKTPGGGRRGGRTNNPRPR
jgi:23S rRNA pseudouridine2605 synthase